MDINDFFGSMEHRPEHPDFWKLSEVLHKLDANIDPATMTQDQMEAAFDERLNEIGVDKKSLVYAAAQRAFRVAGVQTRGDLTAKLGIVMMLSSAWIDAFAAGALYERES